MIATMARTAIDFVLRADDCIIKQYMPRHDSVGAPYVR